MTVDFHALCRAFFVAMVAIAGPAMALPPDDLDARVDAAIREQGVPGMAISIVENGKVVLAKGYGVRRLGAPERIDADTIFPIGSVSKAFTSAALAVLVDEGKIDWDDHVIDRLPGFQMFDPWVTREITIRDLLVHRSGLGLGAGDLLFVPRTSRSRAETVHALRNIKPATSFRSGYAYDNVLYVVAGQVIEQVSGQRWEEFVREHLLKPAGMTVSTTESDARLATSNRVQPHARLDGKMRGIGTQEVLDERQSLIAESVAPAGGVSSSAHDMARWLAIQLHRGALPETNGNASRLFSEAASRQMWTPQVLMPISPYPAPLSDATPQFSAYALGWDVEDYRGVRILRHGGAVFGAQALVVLVPERNLAMSFEINSEDSVVMLGFMYELLDHYLDAPKRDWIADFTNFRKAKVMRALAALDSTGTERKVSRPSLPLAGYVGKYADSWYGPIQIGLEKGRLHIDFLQSPGMTGILEHWQYDTYRTRWSDRSIEPAYVTFALDADGKVGRIAMKAVSPLADFSYDYADLDFRPIAGAQAEEAAETGSAPQGTAKR